MNWLTEIAARLADENGKYDAEAVQALASIAESNSCTGSLLSLIAARMTVRMTYYPNDRKIAAIKDVRHHCRSNTAGVLGLVDSKHFVEGTHPLSITVTMLRKLEALGYRFDPA